MTVAVLCPGPFLDDVWEDDMFDAFDLVIGVNTTAHNFRTHWMAGVDKQCIEPMIAGQTLHRPFNGLITNHGWAPKAQKAGFKTVFPEPYFGINVPKGAPSDRCGYTSPNAIWFARKQAQGGLVEVFGMDFAVGKLGHKGESGDHSAGRWKKESGWLRCYWQPTIVVSGRIDPRILAYIRSDREDYPA
jgi:hypothetical protein